MTTRRALLAGAGASGLAGAGASGLAAVARAAPAAPDDTADWNLILARFLIAGADGVNRFDYARLQADAVHRARLAAQIARWCAQQPSAMGSAQAFAFWCNLYNALTVAIVTERFPVSSIRDISSGPLTRGPWKRHAATVAGRALSLDDIEHAILRKQWREPRVHYALNCASIGCPNLQPRAWQSTSLERDLDAAARAFIAHPRGVRALPDGGVVVSSIYHWFKADFGGDDAGVLSHLRRHAQGDLANRLASVARISGYVYDWSINAPAPVARTPR
jgi:hypothetical protein